MVNLITCDSYFELYRVLTTQLEDTVKNIEKKNLIFCEAKNSLMVERQICSKFGGTINTDVYSFGKYLSSRRRLTNVVSKEGSAMIIKRVLEKVPLKCLKSSKINLASTLYDLIIQLKSAKITPEDLKKGAEQVGNSAVKNKLIDISAVYEGYEEFLSHAGVDDQSSLLSYLPEVIEADDDLSRTDVYILGYSGFTAQVRSAIESLILKANSVTAILTEGDNAQAFVNETSDFIKSACEKLNQPFTYKRVNSSYNEMGKLIVDKLFTPVFSSNEKVDARGKVFTFTPVTPYAEVERVAEIIKKKVISGECRYRDFTIAIPEESVYGEIIENVFETLDIPRFLDGKRNVENHPLVSLITCFIDAKRKNLEKSALSAFYKNPLFFGDKQEADEFENYCIKYNVNYQRILEPFTLEEEKEGFDLYQLNKMRKEVASMVKIEDVLDLLSALSVKEKLDGYTEKLKKAGLDEEAALNEQMYSAVEKVLIEIKTYLGGVETSLVEFKSVFVSGINALKLSVIPQYNDAVFIGDYKQTAIAKANYLFALGLTDSVPAVRQDVALLSDGDIDLLEQIKVKVEPKIKVINHRNREFLALALAAFSEQLFISCPISAIDGGECAKSEVFTTIDKLFCCSPWPNGDKYLTKKQGLNSFSYAIGRFADGNEWDITPAYDYYYAVGEEALSSLLLRANKELKVALDPSVGEIAFAETSPTIIEDYFKCPYRAFLSRTIGINSNEVGEVTPISVGNIMHEIFKNFAKRLCDIKDKESCDVIFNEVAKEVLERKEFKKFILDPVTNASLMRVLSECKAYCYKIFCSMQESSYKVKETEATFGSASYAKYPPIYLNDKKVSLKGKIDRVDEDGDSFRIIDYKTGKIEATATKLYYGNELQLYLYALAVKEGEKGKKPVGLFYLPVSERFVSPSDKSNVLAKGVTLDENLAEKVDGQAFVSQNSVKEEKVFSAYVEYAKEVSDLAAKRMCDGVMVASPISGACEYCEFKSMCAGNRAEEREEESVDAEVIVDAVNEGGEEIG